MPRIGSVWRPEGGSLAFCVAGVAATAGVDAAAAGVAALLMLLPLLLLPLLLLFLLLPLLLRGPGFECAARLAALAALPPLCCTAPLVVSAAHVKVGLCW